MTTVSILKSLIDPNQLAQIISEKYALSEVRCQLIKATMRDVYHIWSEQGEYVAMIYSAETSRYRFRIIDEIKLLKYLSKQDRAFLAPILTADYGDYTTISFPEGQRHLVVYPYIQGKSLSRQPDEQDAFRFGQIVAKLHSLTDQVDQGRDIKWQQDRLLEQPMRAIREQLHYRPDIIAELEPSVSKIRRLLDHLPVDKSHYGVIHADVIPSNAIIAEDGYLYVIDFDLCGYGWRMYDVATFLNELSFWGANHGAEQTFLAGYASMRSVSDAQYASISLLGAARNILELGIAAQKVNIWGNHVYLSEHVINGILKNLKGNLSNI